MVDRKYAFGRFAAVFKEKELIVFSEKYLDDKDKKPIELIVYLKNVFSSNQFDIQIGEFIMSAFDIYKKIFKIVIS